ncbi:MAG: hypothetical protein QOE39_3984 [Bradyrhizobium sp.]|nr:hypothetical protein [Bradyrhizobium sp.]
MTVRNPLDAGRFQAGNQISETATSGPITRHSGMAISVSHENSLAQAAVYSAESGSFLKVANRGDEAKSPERSTRLRCHSITRYRLAVSFGLVAAVWLAAVSRWIVSDTVLPWDSKNQFYAFFRFLSATMRSGDWPFWNPYHYGGHPSVADPQSLVFSPVFVAWGMLDSAPTMRAFDLIVFAHLLAGGLGIAAIGWRARWPISAGVLAAALFMFGGAASGRLQHSGIILSYGVFPLALLLLQLALERRSLLLAAGFAAMAADIALGRNQVALLLCVLLLAAAVAEVSSANRPIAYLRERMSVLVIMAATCGALLIVPVLLTVQFALLSNRPAEVMEDALRGSLYPADLANLAVADVFGTHHSYWGPGAATLPAVALTDDSENYLFVGAVPTLVVLWLGLAGGGVWRPGRRLMTATLASACLFMLGRYTPFYGLAFRFVPGIDLFRRPTDASFVFGIALAILAGHCLSDYVREGLQRLRPIAAVAPGSALLAVVVSAVVFSARTGHAVNAARESLLAGAVMLAAVVLILFGARQRPARVLAAALVTFLAVAELLWWNAASRLNAQSRSDYAVLEAPAGAEAHAIALLETNIAADHRRGDRPRVEVLGLGGPWQNLAMVRGWEAINGYNPLRIGGYDRLVSPGEENWDVSQRRFPPSFDNYNGALAQAFGLTYLVLGQPLDRVPGLPTPPAAELLLAGPPVWIYRIAGAMPRARILSSGNAQTTSGQSTVLSSSVKIGSSRPGRVELVTTSTADGLLVLHDSYYPGWVADVDGKPVPIRRTEMLFRSIELPAGSHHVTFRFAPFSFSNLSAALNAGGSR